MKLDKKMNYKEFSAQISAKFESFRPANVAVHFNVLDEMHANENAHTRVLARLLQQPSVCKSFVGYIAEKRADLAAGLLPFVADNFSVSCLSEYVDARIEYGDKVIIIENKVKDAVDQDQQIDRYVRGELLKHRAADIYVIYLTRDGGKKVQDYSFGETKATLGYKSAKCPGRFISLNYKDHIVDWLRNHVSFTVADLQNQPYLRSGIEQYLHYIEGPELLGVRNDNDPYKDLRNDFSWAIDVNGLDVSVNALAELYKDSIVSGDPKDRFLMDLFRSVVRTKIDEVGQAEIKYWDQLDCQGWGIVDHGYWWRKNGFALQLCENFAIEHAVRALEFFSKRGVEVDESLRKSLAALLPSHPYFTYLWNARTVYKFPVSEKAEALDLAAKLAHLSKLI